MANVERKDELEKISIHSNALSSSGIIVHAGCGIRRK